MLQGDSCTLVDPGARGFMTEVQAMELRRRSRRSMGVEERWVQMYRILFPNDSDIPGPCKAEHTLFLVYN